MTHPRRAAWFLLFAAASCGKPEPAQDPAVEASPPPESEAPVALNADSPIGYPPALYDQRIEGDVVLRLFVDSGGRLVPESTRVAESSGFPALDSAALAGAVQLRFAPAKRRGIAVATAFLQPIEFRHPDGGGGGAPPNPALPTATPSRATNPRARPAPPRPRPDSSAARRDSSPPPPKDTVRADTNEVAH